MLFPSSIQNSVKLKTIFITPSKQNIVSVKFARAASQKHIQWLLSTKKKQAPQADRVQRSHCNSPGQMQVSVIAGSTALN